LHRRSKQIKKQPPFGGRPNLFLKSRHCLVFRQEKVQISGFFDTGSFFVFRQDKEGFRGRQHFFKDWASHSQVLISSTGPISFFGFHRIGFWFSSDWLLAFF
jgi:hypothetical protein